MDVQIYDTMPEGWRMVYGATTAPKGYAWIYNGQSRFSGKRIQRDPKENYAFKMILKPYKKKEL